ncbi:hypothetical protein ACOMHN_041671 [Nucella lapillus]
MHTVSAVVLLTAVVMAQADQMSDLLNLSHHKEHLYIFDVTSKASVEDLKAALNNFTLQGSYKMLEIQQVEENAFQNVLKEATEIFGGTGSYLLSIKRIIKI